jgi:hypothetical protein
MSIAGYAGLGTALAGGIGGGIAAGMQADNNRKYYDQLMQQIQGLQGKVQDTTNQRIGESQEAYAPLLQSFAGNAQDYYNALGNADFSQFNAPTELGQFEFDTQKATQEALNPMLQSIIDRSSGAVMQNASMGSGIHSGSALKGVARATADIQANEYGRAQNQANQQRANKYQEFMDRHNAVLQANQMNSQNLSNTLGAKGTLFNSQAGMFGNQRNEQMGYQNAGDSAQFNLMQQNAQAQAQRQAQPSFWSAFGQGALSGLAGGAGAGADVYSALK